MARGKHKTRAHNRRQNTLEAARDQYKADLQAELEALDEAQVTLAKIEQLEAELALENLWTIDEVEPFATSLRTERDSLQSLYSEARSHYAAISEAWARYSEAATDACEGKTATERFEAFMKILGIDGWLADPENKRTKSVEAITRIQRAQGVRKSISHSSEEQSLLLRLDILLNCERNTPPVLLPSLRQKLDAEGLLAEESSGRARFKELSELKPEQMQVRSHLVAEIEKVRNSKPSNFEPYEVLVWGAGILLGQSEIATKVGCLLGIERVLSNETPQETLPVEVPQPLPSTSATLRTSIATQSAPDVLDAWNHVFRSRQLIAESLGLGTSSYSPVVRHPHPSHGLSLQQAYATSAFAKWLQGTSNPAVAQTAVGLTAAATYWLPAGQTAAFAESEPLSIEDRTSMVLPFPQVFLTFAEPLVFDAVEPLLPSTEEQWKKLSEISRFGLEHDSPMGDLFTQRLKMSAEDWSAITVEDLVGKVGAQVEGVLLLANSLGHPDDLFAWCLTIPGAYGASLGRFVIPAKRSKTAFRDTIDNLTAVVSWAQWHEPDHETALQIDVPMADLKLLAESKDFKRNARRTGVGLRVVNMGTTHRRQPGAPHFSESAVETRIPVTPHIRRGHWRIQRYGEGLSLSRRVRIAPVLVNAGRGDVVARVYRLPKKNPSE